MNFFVCVNLIVSEKYFVSLNSFEPENFFEDVKNVVLLKTPLLEKSCVSVNFIVSENLYEYVKILDFLNKLVALNFPELEKMFEKLKEFDLENFSDNEKNEDKENGFDIMTVGFSTHALLAVSKI